MQTVRIGSRAILSFVKPCCVSVNLHLRSHVALTTNFLEYFRKDTSICQPLRNWAPLTGAWQFVTFVWLSQNRRLVQLQMAARKLGASLTHKNGRKKKRNYNIPFTLLCYNFEPFIRSFIIFEAVHLSTLAFLTWIIRSDASLKVYLWSLS